MPTKEDWYLDSGCSNHMTGSTNSLVNLKPEESNYVTLGDGDVIEIKGVGVIERQGVPNLHNVLLVQGLATNLISINQLFDEGMYVRFTKEECIVTNKENEEVMKGVIYENNCYLWEPKNFKSLTTYPMTNRINEEKDQERTIKSETYTPRTRILREVMDESDNEIFLEELTSEELAAGYSEMCVLNGELSKRLTMYENSYALL
ncbi:uncharacterized protein LOC131613768 [Vicia villosa]|uniref:uncharacterized protein LOC131613768 n=1 Tax=Vicia villosa TaxID=3911 RepID=UPI00273A7D25|nr:uncharacterized protein LOC131613768 [Vicia villosa]